MSDRARSSPSLKLKTAAGGAENLSVRSEEHISPVKGQIELSQNSSSNGGLNLRTNVVIVETSETADNQNEFLTDEAATEPRHTAYKVSKCTQVEMVCNFVLFVLMCTVTLYLFVNGTKQALRQLWTSIGMALAFNLLCQVPLFLIKLTCALQVYRLSKFTSD